MIQIVDGRVREFAGKNAQWSEPNVPVLPFDLRVEEPSMGFCIKQSFEYLQR